MDERRNTTYDFALGVMESMYGRIFISLPTFTIMPCSSAAIARASLQPRVSSYAILYHDDLHADNGVAKRKAHVIKLVCTRRYWHSW